MHSTDRAQMTGLDPETQTIMSICCYVTDAQLALKDTEGWEAIIHHDQAQLDQMGEWCTRTHGNTGLTAACIASTTTPQEAATGLLKYIKQFVPEPRRSLLAGNSVHHDKAFLSKGPYKSVADHLGYRILDVSSIKEAVKRWAPEEVVKGIPQKQTLHQAREDILESIEEARYYKANCFMGRTEGSSDRSLEGSES